jgi:hypothetical protein
VEKEYEDIGEEGVDVKNAMFLIQLASRRTCQQMVKHQTEIEALIVTLLW